MTTLILILHVIVSMALILIVLLQTGKGAEMGASFGGSNQTVFGSQGATTFLGKITTAAAVLFMLTSLSLAYLSSRRSSSVMRDRPAPTAAPESTEAVRLPPPSEIPTEADTGAPALPEIPTGDDIGAPALPEIPTGDDTGAPALPEIPGQPPSP